MKQKNVLFQEFCISRKLLQIGFRGGVLCNCCKLQPNSFRKSFSAGTKQENRPFLESFVCRSGWFYHHPKFTSDVKLISGSLQVFFTPAKNKRRTQNTGDELGRRTVGEMSLGIRVRTTGGLLTASRTAEIPGTSGVGSRPSNPLCHPAAT